MGSPALLPFKVGDEVLHRSDYRSMVVVRLWDSESVVCEYPLETGEYIERTFMVTSLRPS